MKNLAFMRILLSFLMIIHANSVAGIKPNDSSSINKHVISNHCKCGLFSMFFGALNHIAWCEKNHKTPIVYWGPKCAYYEPNGFNGALNAWEYYFEQISNLSVSPSDKIHDTYKAPDGSGIDDEPGKSGCLTMFKYKNSAHHLINKYIKVKPRILKIVNDFYNKHMLNKKTIGIHLRGTDKAKEIRLVPADLIISEASKYKGYQYFIATDEEQLLATAKTKLQGNVIYYDSIRSQDGQPIHTGRKQNQALVGEQVLIETLLLASCQNFIHSCSNVAMAVHYFNPKINAILFSPNKEKYIISGENYKKIK